MADGDDRRVGPLGGRGVRACPIKPTDWQNERDWILNTYLPQRNGSLIQQLRNRGLYPSTEAPTFRVNGAYQHGGTFPLGAVPEHDRAGGDDLLQSRRLRSALARRCDPAGRFGLQRPHHDEYEYAREVTGVRQRRVECD